MKLKKKIESHFVEMNKEYHLAFLDESVGLIEAKDYENMSINMVYNEDTISFSVVLKKVPDSVDEKNDLNEKMLKVMGMGVMPLSTFSIVVEEGVEYYAIDGKVSTDSKASVIMQELNILVLNAKNVIEDFFE